jgi:hypothetical protein
MTEAEEENLENYTNLGEFFRRKLKVTLLVCSALVFNAFMDPPGFLMDPHHLEKLDPDPLRVKSWIRIIVKSWTRIRIKVKNGVQNRAVEGHIWRR